MYRLEEFNLNREDALVTRASTGWLLKWNLGDYCVKAPGYVVSYTWDSVAEVLASCIASDLGIDNVLEYRLCIINLNNKVRLVGCISKNYKNSFYEEVSIQKLMTTCILSRKNYFGKEGYNLIIKEIKDKFNVSIRKYLEDTLLIDSIILNMDRNYWNMSIMLDNNGVGHLAPIYDFGNSLGLTGGFSGEFIEDCMYSNGVHAEPFSYSFEEQLSYIRSNREYQGKLIKTKECLKFIYDDLTEQNNTYSISHPIPLGTFKYTYQVIKKRYDTIINKKIWKS